MTYHFIFLAQGQTMLIGEPNILWARCELVILGLATIASLVGCVLLVRDAMKRKCAVCGREN